MKTVFTSLISVLLTINISVSQEINPTKQLIKNFYKDMFDNIKSPEEILKEYVVYSDSSLNDALSTISYYRLGSSHDEKFVISLKESVNNNSIKIVGYDEFKEEDKVKFLSHNKNRHQDIYKLSFDKEYSLYVRVKGQKIESFFGFQKAGDDNYYFLIYP